MLLVAVLRHDRLSGVCRIVRYSCSNYTSLSKLGFMMKEKERSSGFSAMERIMFAARYGKGLQNSTKWRMLVYGNASFSLISGI
jgi:hypothetical protein